MGRPLVTYEGLGRHQTPGSTQRRSPQLLQVRLHEVPEEVSVLAGELRRNIPSYTQESRPLNVCVLTTEDWVTPLAAFGRIERSVGGDLAEEFKNVADDVRSGASFTVALRSMSQRSPSPSVARFVDGVIVATERGTPMADVLRAQAADSRAASRRQLMEGASKKEALMIAPVVFLVLPMLVVIAIYPGVYGLSFTVP